MQRFLVRRATRRWIIERSSADFRLRATVGRRLERLRGADLYRARRIIATSRHPDLLARLRFDINRPRIRARSMNRNVRSLGEERSERRDAALSIVSVSL